MRTTIGQILVNEALPEELRDYTRVMDKDTADGILKQIADKGDPDLYKKVSNRLDRIGAKASFDEAVTLRLRDLRPISSTRKDVLAYIDREEERIDDNPDLSEKQKNELKAELFSAASESLITETYDKSLKAENPLALQVKAKARGNKGQLTGILTTPGTYQDHRGATVPVFIRRSYSEGLRPDEYWSAAHGGRVGVISTKTSTAKGGYLGKLLSDAALETVVTVEDCGTSNGIPVATNDADNIGSVLAKDVCKFKAGTVITREVISDLNKAKKDEIVIRSPSTCSQHDGVCQLCTGQRESGGFPPLGYHLGQVAASAVREPVAQQALNCLAGDTLVLMSDWTHKQIKDIVAGDRVMGANLQGEIEPTTVTNVFDNGIRKVYVTEATPTVPGLDRTIGVKSTHEHKFLFKGEDPHTNILQPIGIDGEPLTLLTPRDYNLNVLPPHEEITYFIIGQDYLGPLPTYDIEVDNEDHLFVLANGLICSNSKHTGKRYQGQGFSGFEHIKNFTTVPKVYPDRAAVAKQDGRVTKIEPAPQGGTNIWIGDTLHHALTDMEPTVKVGDTVEAGDLLSDGVGNPYEIVKHKGIGEGRRYFIDNWTKILRNSGITTNRRNIEALARSIINHVDIEDEDAAGDQLPGTTATYSGWSKGYQPREGSITTTPGKAVGKYLEAPTMHYSIGTRITPNVVNRLNKHGYNEVVVNDREPGVIPNMKSVTRTSEFSDDWMGQLGSSYLEKRLLQSAQTGAVADAHGINPLPGVAKANELGDPPPGSLSPW